MAKQITVLPFALPLILCLCPEPNAQGIVIPKGAGVRGDLAKLEGSSDLHVPGRFAPSRVQCIYRGKDFAVPSTGLKIGTIALRRDGLKSTKFKAHRWELKVEVSSDGVPAPVDISVDSFDRNHGIDRVIVFQSKAFNWPALPKPSKGPADFSVKIKLDRPFLLLPKRNLCVDFLSTTSSKQREIAYWYVDSEKVDRRAVLGKTRSLGRGCPFGFQVFANAPAIDGESPIRTHAFTRVSVRQGELAFLWTGTNRNTWASINLPFDLKTLGAPTCKIYLQPLFVVLGHTIPTDQRGIVRFVLQIPAKNPAFQGLTFYQQVMVRDAKANALGFRSSNYVEITLGKLSEPLAARQIYNSGPAFPTLPKVMQDAGLILSLLP